MKRILRLLTAALLTALASVNVLAFMQARAMTNFVDSGERTRGPEQLSVYDRIAVILSGVSVPRPQNRRTPVDLNLPYETHEIASANGTKLEVWFIPGTNEEALAVLFHGYAASKSALLSAALAFRDLGYETLLVDFYGFGGSSGSGTTIGVREADDVAAAAAYVRRTWPDRQLVLYGISMGGAAVLRAMAAHGVKSDAVIVEATFDRLLNAGKSRFRAMGLPGSPFAELLLFWGSVQQGFNFFSHNPIEYAKAVTSPALILHGEKDARVTLEQARGIALSMGARARFVGYPGVPHRPIVEASPEGWKRIVRGFLNDVL